MLGTPTNSLELLLISSVSSWKVSRARPLPMCVPVAHTAWPDSQACHLQGFSVRTVKQTGYFVSEMAMVKEAREPLSQRV